MQQTNFVRTREYFAGMCVPGCTAFRNSDPLMRLYQVLKEEGEPMDLYFILFLVFVYLDGRLRAHYHGHDDDDKDDDDSDDNDDDDDDDSDDDGDNDAVHLYGGQCAHHHGHGGDHHEKDRHY